MGFLWAVSGDMPLHFAVEALPLLLWLLLMFGEGVPLGLGSTHLHRNRVIPLFALEGVLPLLFPIFSFLRRPGEPQVPFNHVPLVFFMGHTLPLVDGFWPLLAVHAGLGKSIW